MTRARPLAVLALAALALLAAACGQDELPPTITVEDVATDLLAGFQPGAVVTAPPGAQVAVAPITPGDWMRGDGPRPALAMPAPARVRFRVTVPPRAVLRFGAGVGGITRREQHRSGVRFAVLVDGVERWTRTVNPSATRHDRRWFDERIPIGGETERTIDIELATNVADLTLTAPGLPGWSRLDVARPTSQPRQPASPTAPNVLVLLVDTLRADRVGRTPTLTPTLDGLAARGVAFDQAYAQASWTLQSIPSLMTGLIPASHGVRGNFWGDPSDDEAAGDHVPDKLETWAERAARAGITTVAVSANPLVSRATNVVQGFETVHEFPWDPEHRSFAPADDVNRVFLDWLRAHRGLRFAGYLHYMEPHDPYTPPPAARPAPPAGISDALGAGWVLETARRINFHGAPRLPEAHVAHLRTLYDEEVRDWDASLRALLDALQAEGVLDSTVVVVTADHGEEFQEHGFLKHGQHLHEELVHVPLVIAGPGIPPARRTMLVQGVDLFPTVTHLLGTATIAGLPGRDLLAPELDDAEVVSATSHAVGADGKVVDSLALRTAAWTLLYYPTGDRYALFDRRRDPGEREDRYGVAPEGPALAARLRALLAAAPTAPR
ncbi:MAG: sulfatase, partial [Candidatus Binatia bacterium]